MLTKKEIRQEIRKRKQQFSATLVREQSSRIMHQLEEHPHFQSAQTLLMYYSLPDEPDTSAFIERWHHSKLILLPVVCGDHLLLRKYTGCTNLINGSFSISEPKGEIFTNYEDIDLAVIPGVAFDREGNRLGRGRGYYDRLLERPEFSEKVYKIGICFPFQKMDMIPCDTWDKPMDIILTGEP
ncbi:MAG TPA: 5-formyltetrahydrofolate cyclo-ligase [Alloprevotella sp.]|nr:5-formyltetrahydrofolate cyclo-ligase [Alloprevotella sp.]